MTIGALRLETVETAAAPVIQGVDQIAESDLLTMMLKHCAKSWQATRWLLEIKNPERYGKPKGTAAAGKAAKQLLGVVSEVLAEEIEDDALRRRIESRLMGLTTAELAESVATPPKHEAQPAETHTDAQSEAPHEPSATGKPPQDEQPEPEKSSGLENAAKSPGACKGQVPCRPRANRTATMATPPEVSACHAPPKAEYVVEVGEKPPPLAAARSLAAIAAKKRLKKMRDAARNKQRKQRAQLKQQKRSRRAAMRH